MATSHHVGLHRLAPVLKVVYCQASPKLSWTSTSKTLRQHTTSCTFRCGRASCSNAGPRGIGARLPTRLGRSVGFCYRFRHKQTAPERHDPGGARRTARGATRTRNVHRPHRRAKRSKARGLMLAPHHVYQLPRNHQHAGGRGAWVGACCRAACLAQALYRGSHGRFRA